MNLDNIKEDRDVVVPFIERLLVRLREKHPDREITLDDLSIHIEVCPIAPAPLDEARIRIRRMLADMAREGVVL